MTKKPGAHTSAVFATNNNAIMANTSMVKTKMKSARTTGADVRNAHNGQEMMSFGTYSNIKYKILTYGKTPMMT